MPLSKIPPPATKVGEDIPVPFLEDPDLSTQVDTTAAVAGGVPVAAGSAPSNQSCRPEIVVLPVVNTFAAAVPPAGTMGGGR